MLAGADLTTRMGTREIQTWYNLAPIRCRRKSFDAFYFTIC